MVSKGAFQLEIPYARNDPLGILWNALFPSGSDLRESISYCPELNTEDSILRSREWMLYEMWRQMYAAQRCLEDLEIIEEDERPGSEEERIENPGALDSGTLLRMVEGDPQALDALQEQHYSVLEKWYDQILATRN